MGKLHLTAAEDHSPNAAPIPYAVQQHGPSKGKSEGSADLLSSCAKSFEDHYETGLLS